MKNRFITTTFYFFRIEFYECPRTALYMTLIRTFILHILNITIIVVHRLNSAPKIICWETVVGQDIYRLVILDFIIGVASNMVEFIRSRLNRYINFSQYSVRYVFMKSMNE